MKDDFRRWEFKLLMEDRETTQKILNQWKHIYWLDIISVSAFQGLILTMLTRRKF